MRRRSGWALGIVGAWCLACGGGVPSGAEEGGGGGGDDRDEEVAADPTRAEIAAALKALSATVGDLDPSCNEYLSDSDKALTVGRWVGGLRKDARKSELGCDGSTCVMQIWIADGTYLELDLEVVDGDIDPDDIRCTWAG